MLRVFCLCAMLVMVSACTSNVTAQTLRFNKGLQLGTGKTFAVVAEGAQANNLEFNHYAELVNRRLQTNGLRQAESLAAADYRVMFSYGSERGTRVINTYPDYGVYGGLGSYGHGIGVGGTFYPPRNYRSESYTLYSHELEMRIVEANRRAMPTVFQGRVTTEDGHGAISRAMPCMVAALFAGFPGVDGIEQTVTLPVDACS